MFEATFNGQRCRVDILRYRVNDRLAIRLIDAHNYAPVATATVNIPTVELMPKHVAIKDHDENEGVLLALIRAGIVGHPVMEIVSESAGRPRAVFPVCEILVDVPTIH